MRTAVRRAVRRSPIFVLAEERLENLPKRAASSKYP
jgi:hypothetical protein